MFLVAVTLSVIGQMLVIYFPPLQRIFQTEALTAKGNDSNAVKETNIKYIYIFFIINSFLTAICFQISYSWRLWRQAFSWSAKSRNFWRGSFRDVAMSIMASITTNSKWILYDSYSLPKTKRRKKIITNKHRASINRSLGTTCSRSFVNQRYFALHTWLCLHIRNLTRYAPITRN